MNAETDQKSYQCTGVNKLVIWEPFQVIKKHDEFFSNFEPVFRSRNSFWDVNFCLLKAVVFSLAWLILGSLLHEAL